MKSKKVLVVSANAFSKESNNGKTLEAMFSKFEKREMAQLILRPMLNSNYDFVVTLSDGTRSIESYDLINLEILCLRYQYGKIKILRNG